MKRSALIRQARKVAAAKGHTFELAREGANHSVFTVAGQRIPVPRHNEINEHTARGILAAVTEATK